MKKISLLKGFTLIELLVVITIIWVLATGAVGIYTSQIQKARDSTRLTDLTTLRGAIEQVYSEKYEYPMATTFHLDVQKYLQQLPKDPKHGKTCNDKGAAGNEYCWYAYQTGQDSNGIDQGKYEVSTAFENDGNVDEKAAKDNGNSPYRLEMGIETNTLSADFSSATTIPTFRSGVCRKATQDAPTTATDVIVINGNSTGAASAPPVYCQ